MSTEVSSMLLSLPDGVAGWLLAGKHGFMSLAAIALAAGFGAWFGAKACVKIAEKNRLTDVLATANVAIAAMIALLGRIINFKKNLVAPALEETEALAATLENARGEKGKMAIRLELWPEFPFALRLPNDRIYEYAAASLDLVQLLRALEYSLVDLAHLVRQRNDLIRHMNQHQAAKGALPVDGLNLYIRYSGEIARNVDECLFFLDHGIEKTRNAAKKILPGKLHGAIAEIGLKPETGEMMPPRDLIKGWLE